MQWTRWVGARMARSAIAWQLVFGTCAGAAPGIVLAQQVPPAAEPRAPTEQEIAPPRVAPVIEIPSLRLPETGAPAGAETIFFTLGDLRLEGVTVYDTAALAPYYSDKLGARVSLAELFEVARALETRYRDDGYILTRAVIPAQTVSDGAFRIEVIEGYIGEVVVVGETEGAGRLVRDYVENVTGPRPVNLRDLERYLLLANDIPGITALGVLQPSPQGKGAAQLIVNIERKPFSGFVRVDNRQSKFTGPYQAVGAVSADGFTRFGERSEIILLSAIDEDESRFGQLGFEGRFGDEGFTARGRVSYAPSEPGSTLRPLDVEGRALRAGVSGTYPILRSRRTNLSVSGGFDYADVETDILGQSLSDDNLRVLWVGLSADHRDTWMGASQLRLQLRQGLDALGASEAGDPALSRPDADGVFTTVNLDAARLQRVTEQVSLYLGAAGQIAFDPVLSDEEFTLGGYRFGRGYDPAELARDIGAAATAELQFAPPIGQEYVEGYHLYGFYDVGKVWDDDFELGESLASAGLGVRSEITEWLRVELEAAKPLTRPRAADTDDRKAVQYYFTLTAQF